MTWSQKMRSKIPGAWTEKHKGRAFYDRRGNVWSIKKRLGYRGYHKCGMSREVGFEITVLDCPTERRYDLKKRPISEWDTFKVSFLFKGVPIRATHDMHVNIYPNGKIYGHY